MVRAVQRVLGVIYLLKNLQGILRSFLRRWKTIFSMYKYDYVFIHREAAHIGPPIFEFLIAKIFRKTIHL